MNTQLAFAFGMLAMIAITMLVVLVVGIVKVHRQGNAITSLEKWIDNTNLSADQNMQVLEQRISNEVEHLNKRMDDEHRNINYEIDDTRKLMDSRFDKFEDKITKKQLLTN